MSVQPTVPQWGRFECAVQNAARYTNPYGDVTLQVTYRRPDGSTVDFWGFHDGETTWRFRVMADQVGQWQYKAVFTDGTPGAEGQFTCVPSDLPGMITADQENPIWFGYKDGGHTLIRSLHVGDCFFASNMPRERRTAFLDWAQQQGYNMLSIGSHYLNRRQAGRGEGWQTPVLWPLNAGEYQKMERILDELTARRLLVFPFGGFFGRGSTFPSDPGEQELYIRYTLARLGANWNFLLNVSGPEPLLANVEGNNPVLPKPQLDRLANLIRALDPFGHPLTIHNKDGDDQFADEQYINYVTLQGPKTVDLAKLSEGLLRNHHPRKPLYVQETLWSGNKYHPVDYSDADLRRNAYVILLSAGALNFADNGGPRPGDLGDSSSGFSGTLVLKDRRQWRHDILKKAWDLLDELPFWRMSPRQDLVTAGYCLAEPGSQYLVYLPDGGAVTVHIEQGTYDAIWINADEPGERIGAGRLSSAEGLRNPVPGQHCLLYLTRSA